MVWAIDDTLQGGQYKYKITGNIGAGGFGTVYRAVTVTDSGVVRDVVIKTPLQSHKTRFDYKQLSERLESECKKLKKLGAHSNLVEFIEDFTHKETDAHGITTSTYCVVTAFIEGQNLQQLIQGLRDQQQFCPVAQALHYVQQIGEALSFLHRNKQVHRDAHPANIMITKAHQAILIDLGLATDLAIATGTVYHHAHDNFAPPEQKQGSAELTVDVYTLAATLYFALTGEVPTSSTDRAAALKAHQLDPLLPLKRIRTDLDDYLVAGVMQGMEISPSKRPKQIHLWLKMLEPPAPSPDPMTKPAFNSFEKTGRAVRGAFKTILHSGNSTEPKEIPWAWLVWSATVYTSVSALFTVVTVPGFLMTGLWILGLAWGLIGAGEWVFSWVRFLTLVWLSGGTVVVFSLLQKIFPWLGILFVVSLTGGIGAFWHFQKDFAKGLFRAWTNAHNLTIRNLKGFSPFHRFLILAGANVGGILLGLFLHRFLKP